MMSAMIRPDVQAFLAFLNSAPSPKLHELSPAEARTTMTMMREFADVPVGELAVIRDLTIDGPAGSIPARLFDARDTRSAGPAMVFFHGGGWVIGDLDTHAPFCAQAARMLDIPIIAADYRLAPEHPFPAAGIDCEAAARWVATSPDVLERTVTSLVLCGDSAGGNMTIITAMALRDNPANVPVTAQFPIYPATDMSKPYASMEEFGEDLFLTKDSMQWFGDHYAADVLDVRTSPLLGSQAGMPPTLLITAGLDPLRDQGRAYVAALAVAGVPVIFREAVGNIHGFINLAQAIPSSVADIAGALMALKTIIAEAEHSQ